MRWIALIACLAALTPACQRQDDGPQTKTKLVGNATCPVSGKPVAGSPGAPSFHSDFRTWRIGFMCPVCKGKFDEASEAQKAKWLQTALMGGRAAP